MARSLKISFMIIGAVFVVFFFAMFKFVTTAMQAYEPPIDSGYYEKGLDYQKRLDEFDRAKSAGWSIKVNVFETDSISRGTYPLMIGLERDSAKPGSSMKDDSQRVVATVTVSHRATMEGSRKFEFRQSDLEMKGKDRYELKRNIEIPMTGSAEIAVEVRPTQDSAIYQAKTLLVK